MSIRVWYTGDHNYDVRDFDEVWPEHKDAVALLDAVWVEGVGKVFLEGVGLRYRYVTTDGLYYDLRDHTWTHTN